MVAVVNGESLPREAPSMARWASHFHIGHEVHFDGEHPRALTALTAPTRDVEREMPRGIS